MAGGKHKQMEGELPIGNADAFAAFYRRNEDAVLGFFLRRTRRADLAADLTAESFARALESRHTFDPALGESRAWLFGIARNVLAHSLQKSRVDDETRVRLRMEPMVLTDDDLDRIDELGDEPALSAMELLPVDQQTAVSGRVIEEHDYAELATKLRCSESVVRQRVSRGLRSLRHVLEGDA